MDSRFASALLLGSMMSGPALAATIDVHPGQSIQAALDTARSGDTVAVHAGTYHESVTFRGSGQSGAPIRLISADGVGRAHIASPGTPITVMGGRYKEVSGFTLTAGAGGNGLEAGGTVDDFANHFVIANNTIVNAGLDGIKVHQLDDSVVSNNEIRNAGSRANNSNMDGGIDFVAARGVRVLDNRVLRTGGNTCLMLKGGSRDNLVRGNDFSGCRNAVHIGGLTGERWQAPDARGREAYNNTISGNNFSARECAIYQFSGERRRNDNTIQGNALQQNGNCAIRSDGTGVDTSDAGSGGETEYQNETEGGEDGGGSVDDVSPAQPSGEDDDGSDQNGLLHNVSSVSESDCGLASGVIGTAGSIVTGLLGGGRATLPAQVAQQTQLIFHSICAAKQLEAQLKAIEGLGINTVGDVEQAMVRVQSILGRSQQVSYELARADADWNRVFIDTNGLRTMPSELAYPQMGQRYGQLRQYSDAAMKEAARVRAQAVTNMKSSNQRSRTIVNASADAVGPTQAVQAGNLLVLETRQELQGMHETMLSYNEAQSRISQEGRVRAVVSDIFLDKNLESMNPEPTPVQGAVVWNDGQQQTVAAPDRAATPLSAASPRRSGLSSGFTAGSFSN